MRGRQRSHRRLAAALVVAALVAVGVLAPSAADAHPFGDPQTVEVEPTDDGAVRVTWRAGGADDLTLLAVELGALPDERVMMDGAVWYEDGDADALAASSAFTDYLLDRITVTSGRTRCRGEVTGLDLVGAGAALEFACAEPVATATVDVTTLLDLHPAYRTLATGPDGQRAVYDEKHTAHDWALSQDVAAADVGRSAAVQLSSIGAVALTSVLAGLLWFRRRGRRA